MQMKRRTFLQAALGTAFFSGCSPICATSGGRFGKRPNVVFILADDLGYAELGCYGQTRIRTPNIDRLAAEGMRFTQHYSGSPVCAPSRCTLMTGLHTGHSYVRDNREMGGWERGAREGQLPLPAQTVTLPELLQAEGYHTGAMGKWGLGGPDSTGEPNQQGFDQWFGYLCQRIAHNYYPEHVWKNQTKYLLKNNYFSAHQKFPPDKDPNDPASYESYAGIEYAPDLMTEEALSFIRANQNRPFFLYLPYPIPHVSLQVPEDSLREYEGAFPETPYLGERGYLPHRTPRAAYAAMVTRMDGYVGRILALLGELHLDNDTLVFFSSDNGPTFNGGTDSAFFNSAGPLRDLKGSVYEGGIRVPMIARWPGRIKAGSTTDHSSAFWDVLPTVMEAAGAPSAIPKNIDGISFLPTLLGRNDQRRHDYLYWEYHSGGGRQAVRMGDWKGVRLQVGKGNRKIELYNLKEDIGETTNVADKYPDIVTQIARIMEAARTESEHFHFGRK
ncbi:MAG: arylsulfatase [Sedimentisphaerales bacterium]|nr:arylsulfatase [Sedimentisphaerales bacterium]